MIYPWHDFDIEFMISFKLLSIDSLGAKTAECTFIVFVDEKGLFLENKFFVRIH